MKKKVKTPAKKAVATNVHFILDKSGSMGHISETTISGFNEYIDTLKADKKGEYRLSLTVFDTEINMPEKNTPLVRVRKLTSDNYIPSGMTALYDAVCMTLQGVNKKSKEKNLVVIMTDGEENASREFKLDDMVKLKKELEKGKNWTFVFLGANQDAWIAGQKMGMARGNTVTYNNTKGGMGQTMRSLAQSSVQFCAQSASSTDNYFSEKERGKIENTK